MREILLIAGHSTDATRRIACGFPKVQYFLQGGDGIPDAYNQGVNLAKGELVAFLSSDDLWTPEKLEVQVRYLAGRNKSLKGDNRAAMDSPG